MTVNSYDFSFTHLERGDIVRAVSLDISGKAFVRYYPFTDIKKNC